MPNIIEQQDLLKGLPDDRLSTLMQNPTGDIPPFLVAAEAQRRQSIREQFSGGPQESVVDTLTKQMANVPQNIQAPAQQPPQMPQQQMPEMGGVAALQGEQQMRSGGYVQRYQEGSLVQRSSVEGLASDISGLSLDEYLRQQEAKKIEALGPGKARFLLENPVIPKTEAQTAEENFRAATEGVFSGFYSPESVYDAAQEYSNVQNAAATDPFNYGMSAADRIMGTGKSVQTASPVNEPRDPNAGKGPTSSENKGISLEEYKRQLEAIYGVNAEDSEYIQGKLREFYGDNEASNWERAQKWFAAAQAAIEPGQTNMQAAINALSALGGGYAEERAAERENKQALAEALFKLEIGDRDQKRQAEQEIAKQLLQRQISQQEAQAEAAEGQRDYLREIEKIKVQNELAGKRDMEKERFLSPTEAIRSYDQEIKYLQERLDSGMLTPEARERTIKQIDSLLREKAVILKNSGYGGSSVPTMDDMRRAAAGQ
jgi:hypothetical protein